MGFPALLYQIVWQRSLFTLYGGNIGSLTMVVTAFMLGLGLGSLLGGTIWRSQHLPLLRVFGPLELLVAASGVFSLKILHFGSGLHGRFWTTPIRGRSAIRRPYSGLRCSMLLRWSVFDALAGGIEDRGAGGRRITESMADLYLTFHRSNIVAGYKK